MTELQQRILKATTRYALILLAILTFSYILIFIYDFYKSEIFLNAFYLPTIDGYIVLLKSLWISVLFLFVLIGSLLGKNWSWYAFLFIIYYSVTTTVIKILYVPENRALNYLELLFYFALITVLSNSKIKTYHKVEPNTKHYSATAIITLVVYYFTF